MSFNFSSPQSQTRTISKSCRLSPLACLNLSLPLHLLCSHFISRPSSSPAGKNTVFSTGRTLLHTAARWASPDLILLTSLPPPRPQWLPHCPHDRILPPWYGINKCPYPAPDPAAYAKLSFSLSSISGRAYDAQSHALVQCPCPFHWLPPLSVF